MKRFGKRDLPELALTGADVLPLKRDEPPVIARHPEPDRLAGLREQVLKQIDTVSVSNLSITVLTHQVERIVNDLANEQRLELSGPEQMRLAQDLTNDMLGYGPLTSLLLDDRITDIMVNGPTSVYVDRDNGQRERVAIRFRDFAHIATIAQKIAARVGRRIDEQSPMVDARLPDGSRVNVIFPPLAVDGPCISIRKFPKHHYDLAGLVKNGSLNAAIAQLLEIATRCRLNILISGGTGAGKTTLLNAMSQSISSTERIISIEDAAELQLQQPHVIRLETRPPNLEGNGQITQRDLVWNALRMYPDRIIVGEVRGAEAFDMLQAMNTGHDGSISTIHANNTRDAVTRVENLVQMGHINLPLKAIRSQIVSALDLIVQVERMRDGSRKVVQVTEICGLEGDVVTTNDVAVFKYNHDDAQGRIQGDYHSVQAVPKFLDRLAYFGLDRIWLETMRGITGA
jgi:pilus assembly protein CpaF